jgi:hypothetical protein
MEYLVDYASPETVAAGERCSPTELERIDNPELRTKRSRSAATADLILVRPMSRDLIF